jgi:hypothetical protein
MTLKEISNCWRYNCFKNTKETLNRNQQNSMFSALHSLYKKINTCTLVYLDVVHCRIIFALFCREIYMTTILKAFVNVVLTLKHRKCVSDYKFVFSFGNLTEHLYLWYICFELYINLLQRFTCEKNVLIILCINSTIPRRKTFFT